jgi:hypothetical protein
MGAHDLFAIRFYTSPCMFYIYAPPVSPFLRKIFNKNKNREREREKTTLQFLSGSRYYKKSRVRSECRSRKKRTGFNLNTLPAAWCLESFFLYFLFFLRAGAIRKKKKKLKNCVWPGML